MKGILQEDDDKKLRHADRIPIPQLPGSQVALHNLMIWRRIVLWIKHVISFVISVLYVRPRGIYWVLWRRYDETR